VEPPDVAGFGFLEVARVGRVVPQVFSSVVAVAGEDVDRALDRKTLPPYRFRKASCP